MQSWQALSGTFMHASDERESGDYFGDGSKKRSIMLLVGLELGTSKDCTIKPGIAQTVGKNRHPARYVQE